MASNVADKSDNVVVVVVGVLIGNLESVISCKVVLNEFHFFKNYENEEKLKK